MCDIIVFAEFFAFAFIGLAIAKKRGRNKILGFILGFVVGIPATIIINALFIIVPNWLFY